MEFPDGVIKPAFLLTSLNALVDRDIQPKHLDRYGLRRGIDYFVANATQFDNTVPEWNSMTWRRGRKTILSLSGLLMTITQTRTDFGDALFYWIYDTVLPSLLRGESIFSNDPILQDLRALVAQMSDEILGMRQEMGLAGYFKNMTLEDLIGASYEIGQEGR